jgi:hypothetical protein
MARAERLLPALLAGRGGPAIDGFILRLPFAAWHWQYRHNQCQ